MNVVSVICILLKDCLRDIIVYLLDILLLIQLTLGKIIWLVTPERKKPEIRAKVYEQLKALESGDKETNSLAISALTDYYNFIKEN